MTEYKMTPFQKNIWNMQKRYEGTCVGNEGGCLYIQGEVGEELFAKVMQQVMWLNPALRLRVGRTGEMYLSDSCMCAIDAVDLSGEIEEAVEAYMQELINVPVFAYDAPLVHYYRIRCRDGYALMGTFYHLCIDGIGFQRITEQTSELLTDPQSSVWEEEPDERFLIHLRRWDMQGSPEGKEELRLERGLSRYGKMCQPERFVFPIRRGAQSVPAGILYRSMGKDENGALMQWLAEQGLTIEHAYLAAYAVYCSRITGSEWVAVGRGLMNRKKSDGDTVGMYVNTLPLMIEVGADFLEICKAVKRDCFTMLRYCDIPVERLREHCQLSGRLYDIQITYRPIKRMPKVNQSVAKILECNAVELPLRVGIDEREEDILFTYKYQLDAYTQTEVERLDESLWQIIGDGAGLYEKEIKEAGERMERVNGLPMQRKPDGTMDVLSYFQNIVRQEPRKVLWVDISETPPKYVSYGEAYKMMQRLAGKLRRKADGARIATPRVENEPDAVRAQNGVQPVEGQAVTWSDSQPLAGLCLHRSYRLPLAMLACLNAGIIFVPISPEESDERKVELKKGMELWIEDDTVDEWLLSKDETKTEQEGQISLEAIAYAIHTSGSAGEPKLVQIRREALNLRLHWMMEEFHMKGCRLLQKTRSAFDVSVWELLLAPMCGGMLVLLPDGKERIPEQIWRMAVMYKVSHLHFVPSMLDVFLSWVEVRRKQEQLAESLTDVFASGEQLPGALAERFYQSFPNVKLHNLYGPAECTIDVTYHTCKSGEGQPPIGKPVWNTGIHIVNSEYKEVPDGYIGEILVTGDLVGCGYRDNPQETARSFRIWNGQRAYATKDVGYINAQGEAVYVGRMNREVKLRGMRVLLDTLEQEAMRAGARQAAAIVDGSQLILFVKTNEPEEQLRAYLAKRLAPHYMPDVFHQMEQMPITANGKCDYRKLLALHKSQRQAEGKGWKPDAPFTKLERKLAECIEAALGIQVASPGEPLSIYGMDSLSVVQLLVELEKAGFALSYEEIFFAENIHALAETIKGKHKECHTGSLYFYPEIGQTDTLIIGVPYAGTGRAVLDPLAQSLGEMGYAFAACQRHVTAGTKLSEEADSIVSRLDESGMIGTKRFVVLGCCVGAALALELVRKISDKARISCPLIFIESLPVTLLPWEYLPRHGAGLVLSAVRGKKMELSHGMYGRLQEEAGAALRYFAEAEAEPKVHADTLMIFGSRDPLTLGFQYKYRKWESYLSGHVHVSILAGAKHFATQDYAQELAGRIDEYLKET